MQLHVMTAQLINEGLSFTIFPWNPGKTGVSFFLLRTSGSRNLCTHGLIQFGQHIEQLPWAVPGPDHPEMIRYHPCSVDSQPPLPPILYFYQSSSFRNLLFPTQPALELPSDRIRRHYIAGIHLSVELTGTKDIFDLLTPSHHFFKDTNILEGHGQWWYW